jgi:hypothetical protein
MIYGPVYSTGGESLEFPEVRHRRKAPHLRGLLNRACYNILGPGRFTGSGLAPETRIEPL